MMMTKNSELSYPACEEIRPHLDAYFDGEIADRSLRSKIDQHLSRCSRCQEELRVLDALDNRLRSLSLLEVSASLEERKRNAEAF